MLHLISSLSHIFLFNLPYYGQAVAQSHIINAVFKALTGDIDMCVFQMAENTEAFLKGCKENV